MCVPSRAHPSTHCENWKRSIVWYAKYCTHKMDVSHFWCGDGDKVSRLWFACNSCVYMLLLYSAITVLLDDLERSWERLVIDWKRVIKKCKKSTFFLKKKCLFRHFSVSFVIFIIKVNELEDWKISPIQTSQFCNFNLSKNIIKRWIVCWKSF